MTENVPLAKDMLETPETVEAVKKNFKPSLGNMLSNPAGTLSKLGGLVTVDLIAGATEKVQQAGVASGKAKDMLTKSIPTPANVAGKVGEIANGSFVSGAVTNAKGLVSGATTVTSGTANVALTVVTTAVDMAEAAICFIEGVPNSNASSSDTSSNAPASNIKVVKVRKSDDDDDNDIVENLFEAGRGFNDGADVVGTSIDVATGGFDIFDIFS